MRTSELVLAMGFLSMLFGCGQGGERYQSEAAYERNVSTQVAMTPQLIEQLRAHGVGADAALRLEYYFYTDTKAKAAELVAALSDLEYDARFEEAAIGDGTFVITGWTTRIKMDTPVVVAWAKEMCHLGHAHDAEFDGWGTNPDQAGTAQQGDAPEGGARRR